MSGLLPGLKILEVYCYSAGFGTVVETVPAPYATFPDVGAIMVPFEVELL
jgi:hypothetical protein